MELTEPWQAVEGAGGTPAVSPEGRQVQAFHHLDAADTFPADADVADADPATYDGLVLPGGVANPDPLRIDDERRRLRPRVRRGRHRSPRSATLRGR